jgi:hypothetical protein
MTQFHQTTSLACQSKPKYSFESLSTIKDTMPGLSLNPEELSGRNPPEITIFDFCFFQISDFGKVKI